ncbi:S-adenosyl-L-methionine-dependent methyltransferase [Russula vinacea]|nr:S-adenosyl-L-methionine-dependent methyltransferase [Russula vinacea]
MFLLRNRLHIHRCRTNASHALLLSRHYGYYMNPANPVIGARGDFITSPEISQVFGEVLYGFITIPNSGVKHDVQLRNAMDDILRVHTVTIAHSRSSVKHVHLVESSLELHWHDSIEDVPTADGVYTMLVAHEFFDALPFHLIEKTHQGWKEVLITSSSDPAAKTILRHSNNGSLSQSSHPPSAMPSHDRSHLHQNAFPPCPRGGALTSVNITRCLLAAFSSLPIGARIEVSAVSFRIARKLGTLISQGAGGSALIVDYGTDHAVGNSFRAFKGHALADPFDRPGQADLTANVDFAYLAEALAGTATTHGPLSQRSFLLQMGIDTRVAALERAAAFPERGVALGKAAARLVDGAGMGKEYKVMGVTGVEEGTEGCGRLSGERTQRLCGMEIKAPSAFVKKVVQGSCDRIDEKVKHEDVGWVNQFGGRWSAESIRRTADPEASPLPSTPLLFALGKDTEL